MSESAKMQPPASSTLNSPEHLKYKNRLQEYAQRSAIQLPIYQTVSEGPPHDPKFRATVLVDGESYKSHHTFSHRKAAEQDVAKLALEGISKKIRDGGCPLIREDTTFCKSILNEFAVKMNLEIPNYATSMSEGGLLPVFISSLVFNGKTFTGDPGRNKKEAEQLAARTVINSTLGNCGSGTLLSEIIKSKVKLYAALHKVKGSGSAYDSNAPMGVLQGNRQLPISACLEAPLGQLSNVPLTHQPLREFKKLKQECESSAGAIRSAAEVLDKPLCAGQAGCEPVLDTQLLHDNQIKVEIPSLQTSVSLNSRFQDNRITGKKRPRKNKKGKKNAQIDEQLQMTSVPVSTTASCPVSL